MVKFTAHCLAVAIAWVAIAWGQIAWGQANISVAPPIDDSASVLPSRQALTNGADESDRIPTSRRRQPSTSLQRVRGPDWTQVDMNAIFFENAFRDALVGQRPATLSPPQTLRSWNDDRVADAGSESSPDGASIEWSRLISTLDAEKEGLFPVGNDRCTVGKSIASACR